jgi:hypothetical protein
MPAGTHGPGLIRNHLPNNDRLHPRISPQRTANAKHSQVR